jgi:hypothetical protein
MLIERRQLSEEYTHCLHREHATSSCNFLAKILRDRRFPHLEQAHAIVSGPRKGEAMKLRIKGNSLRLRVSRSELARFLAGEQIVETIRFASALEAKLTYVLARDSHATAASVRYLPQEVTVVLAEEQVQAWGQDSQVGVYTTVDIAPEELLEVIVEKDFACIDRSDEDNTDTFPNPLGKTC